MADQHRPIVEPIPAEAAWVTTQLIAPHPSISWAVFVLGTGEGAKATVVPVVYVAVQHLRSELEPAPDEDAEEEGPIEDVESRVVPIIFDDALPPRPLVLEPSTPGWCGLSGSKEAAEKFGDFVIKQRHRRADGPPLPGLVAAPTPPASLTAPDEGEKKGKTDAT